MDQTRGRPLPLVAWLCASVSMGLGCKDSSATEPPIFDGSITELDDAVREADLIFEGEVIAIEYANSLNNGVGGPDGEEGSEEDRAQLPHTFVTYEIVERFKGNYEARTITLRFLGGIDPTPVPSDTEGEMTYDVTLVSELPLFDLGDRDIMFMKGNTDLACPLQACAQGRFRILTSPQDSEPFVFTELGEEVRLVTKSETRARLFFFGEHQIPEILQQTLTYPDGSSSLLEIVSGEEEPGEEDPAGAPATLGEKHSQDLPDGVLPKDQPEAEANASTAGTRITPSQIRVLILAAVKKVYPNAPDFSDLPPVVSADPAEPFSVAMFSDTPGPENDDDPRVERPTPDEVELAEASAAETFDLEADNLIPTDDANAIIGRRQTLTGIVEMPNEEDEQSAAEDMWTEVRR